ncbi:5585_t:CDS:2 [Ambispora leptoticha]|uniref:5585_t:CDS:1 n=1 Tax=Ambispora leptoticha TaxID=144679 RepID=A0A9N8YY35_9GLOM|nr:5585_t:CDS:2 [Ambispora leptoticha]
MIKNVELSISKNSNEHPYSKTGLGLIYYVDPAYIKDSKFKRNQKSDIYSLGVLFWVISSGRAPTNKFSYLSPHSGEKETTAFGTPIKYVNLYQNCWNSEPEHRPDIYKVVELLNDIEWPSKYLDTDQHSISIRISTDSLSQYSNSSNNEKISTKDIIDELWDLLNKNLNSGETVNKTIKKLDIYLKTKTTNYKKIQEILQTTSRNSKYLTLLGFLYHSGIIFDMDHELAFIKFKETAKEDEPLAQFLIVQVSLIDSKAYLCSFKSIHGMLDCYYGFYLRYSE